MQWIAEFMLGLVIFSIASLAAWLWLQQKKGSWKVPVSSAPTAGFDSLVSQMRLLDNRTQKLETEQKALSIEWADTFTKLNRLAGRIARTKGWDDKRTGEEATTTLESGKPTFRSRSEVLKMSRRGL